MPGIAIALVQATLNAPADFLNEGVASIFHASDFKECSDKKKKGKETPAAHAMMLMFNGLRGEGEGGKPRSRRKHPGIAYLVCLKADL